MPTPVPVELQSEYPIRSLSEDLRAFVLFMGHPRSGTTLLANLLDAHPHAVIAYQHDAVGRVASGERISLLFEQLIANSRDHAGLDRQTNGYAYRIPNQWQGRFQQLKVIGDKKAAAVSEQLADNPELIDQIRTRIGLPLRVIQMVRNPFDNIATMTRKTPQLGGDLATGVRHYLKLADKSSVVRSRLSDDEIIHVRHEDLVANTPKVLAAVCQRLGIEPKDDYLKACASIVFPEARKTRHSFNWPADLIRLVEQRIQTDGRLSGYTFDDDDQNAAQCGPNPD